MRIYNGKNSVINVPLGNQRITVPAHSISSDFMPSTDFIRTMSVSFDVNEVALIVVGAWEGNMCAGVPAVQPLCVSSLDEALARFNSPLADKKVEQPKKVSKKEDKKEEPKPKKEEPVVNVEENTKNEKESIAEIEIPAVKEEEVLPPEEAEVKKEELKKTRKTRSSGKKTSSKKTKKS